VLLTSADVDEKLRAEWERAGVAPVPAANDATWLRRLWLDVVGTIPPPEVTTRFLARRHVSGSAGAGSRPEDSDRAQAIEELLASPAWADYWTAYYDDLWMGRGPREPDVDRGAFRSWLHDAFARNVPWNVVVTELLTATGQNSDGRPRRASEQADGKEPAAPGVNGAVNWTLKYRNDPQDMAGDASRTLLGVQIQCAQCHDHKTEKWTQADFQGFAAAFVRTALEPIDSQGESAGVPSARRPIDVGPPMGAVKRVRVRDLARPAPRFAKMGDLAPIAKAKPASLDGSPLGEGTDVRAALARWVTAPNNPWFARATVNRVWAHFLGRGFVDPVDDFRESQPPVAPELLDALAADFVRSGYDLKHLVRVVAGTQAYALAAVTLPQATSKADPDARLWERFRVTPLGPEELLNALVAATRLDAIVRSTGRLDLADVRFRMKQRYGFLFDVDEQVDEPDYEGTIAQGLALLNGNVVATGASDLPGSALAEVLAMPEDASQDGAQDGTSPAPPERGRTQDGTSPAPPERGRARLDALYLRVLSRLPTPEETARLLAFLADAESPRNAAPPAPPPGPKPAKAPGPQKNAKPPVPDPLRGLADRAGNAQASARVRAWEDILWSLLNSSEFVLNH